MEVILFTAFVVAALVLQVPKGYSQENLILGLIYAFFICYRIFDYVPTTIFTKPWMYCIHKVSEPIMRFPKHVRSIAYGIFVLAVIVVTVFALPEKPESLRTQRVVALFGMIIFFLCLFATSTNRKAINWNTVLSGILIQFILALFVFRSSVGQDIFSWASSFAQTYLSKAHFGAAFIFGEDVAAAAVFAVSVFPTLIFFAATVQILYYYGALQWLLSKVCRFFS